jgi:hypothetical protein
LRETYRLLSEFITRRRTESRIAKRQKNNQRKNPTQNGPRKAMALDGEQQGLELSDAASKG